MRGNLIALLALITLLAACSHTPIAHLPSANKGQRVKSVVIHFTTVDYAESVHALSAPGGVSAHYLISQQADASSPFATATTVQMVDEHDRAWHAGISYWQQRDRLNDTSIGIELVYQPRCDRLSLAQAQAAAASARLCQFPDYDPDQIEALVELLIAIQQRYPDISPTSIVGHADIAFARKMDPGPRFPWQQLYHAGIGAWYDDEALYHHWQLFSQRPLSIALLQQALFDYGYGVTLTGILDLQTRHALAAFQMHFVPWQVTGEPDPPTSAAVMALLQKYFTQQHSQIMTVYHAAERPTEKPAGPLLHAALSKDAALGFATLQGQGNLTLRSTANLALNIRINGKNLAIDRPVKAGQKYAYNLAELTRSGLNSLQITGLDHRDATLQVAIDYPQLLSPVSPDTRLSTWQPPDSLAVTVIEQGKLLHQTGPAGPGVGQAVTQLSQLLAAHYQQKLQLEYPVIHYVPYFSGAGRERCRVKDILSLVCRYRGAGAKNTPVSHESAYYDPFAKPAYWRHIQPAELTGSLRASSGLPPANAQQWAAASALLNSLLQVTVSNTDYPAFFAAPTQPMSEQEARQPLDSAAIPQSELPAKAPVAETEQLIQRLLNAGGYGDNHRFSIREWQSFAASLRPQKGYGWSAPGEQSWLPALASPQAVGLALPCELLVIDPALYLAITVTQKDCAVATAAGKPLLAQSSITTLQHVYLALLNN